LGGLFVAGCLSREKVGMGGIRIRGDFIRQIPLNPPFSKGEVNGYNLFRVRSLMR